MPYAGEHRRGWRADLVAALRLEPLNHEQHPAHLLGPVPPRLCTLPARATACVACIDACTGPPADWPGCIGHCAVQRARAARWRRRRTNDHRRVGA